jgi:hypothetical protein
MHEADEPNGVVDLLDSELLTGEHGRDIDFLSVHSDAAAGGDGKLAVMSAILGEVIRSQALQKYRRQ